MEDDDLIPLSALQHYLYCPRQCALIHVEQQWEENRQTAEGRLLHQRADQPQTELRHGIRTATAMPLASRALGISGIADVVEFHSEQPFPVEYKRGRPKAHRADEVQLCAQALCLEEMLGRTVPEGALFYGQTHRRKAVTLDLVEEFRPVLADRLALSLINRKQLTAHDFQFMDNGAVLLRDEARKTVLIAYQERKRETLRHGFLEESVPLGLFMFIQAQLLARHLRGDLDAYPPFIWK